VISDTFALAALCVVRHVRAMRILSVLIALLMATSALAQAGYELNNSLRDRAKWKTFGVQDWVADDPIERARAGRGRIAAAELDNLAGNTPVARLKSLIAVAEAGPKGYDAVHVGAKRKLPKRPTQMTLREIAIWVKATPGQPHAIGRYQIIPSTMRALIRRSGVSPQSRFSPKLQDSFADILLQDAGLDRFLNGRISRKKFMNNLAKIWAGLPTSNGKSYYDGYAGNRATITLKYYRTQMAAFFPKSS
jgi:muramidase (phage lysozyme)